MLDRYAPAPTQHEVRQLLGWNAEDLRVFWRLLGRRHGEARTLPTAIPRTDWHKVQRAAQRELSNCVDSSEATLRGVDGYETGCAPFPSLRHIWACPIPADR
jgi:hypothetical protein